MIFKKIKRLLFGKDEGELHIHVHVHLSNNSTRQEVGPVTVERVTPIQKRSLADGPSAQEIAELVLTGGLEKAVDRGGDGAVEKATSSGVDDHLESIKRIGDKIKKT
jgi:hypothetical protein